jgi:hypothetical protein
MEISENWEGVYRELQSLPLSSSHGRHLCCLFSILLLSGGAVVGGGDGELLAHWRVS